ncbi:MAG: cupin domain-containing protein [Bacteroidota bacterium]
MKEDIERLVQKLGLVPHPEGGYFKETYRSIGAIPTGVLGKPFQGNRNFCTAIYFLLTSDSFSAFHKIEQDEIWHFYCGAPITLHQISPEGDYSKQLIGSNILTGETPQLVVPARSWFAAAVDEKDRYALVGCTVAPGFDFSDFTLANCDSLVAKFPQHKEIIVQFTRF